MKRFRLIRYTDYGGNFRYEIQRKFLFFWIPFHDEGGNRKEFKSEEGAKNYLSAYLFKEKKEVIHYLP